MFLFVLILIASVIFLWTLICTVAYLAICPNASAPEPLDLLLVFVTGDWIQWSVVHSFRLWFTSEQTWICMAYPVSLARGAGEGYRPELRPRAGAGKGSCCTAASPSVPLFGAPSLHWLTEKARLCCLWKLFNNHIYKTWACTNTDTHAQTDRHTYKYSFFFLRESNAYAPSSVYFPTNMHFSGLILYGLLCWQMLKTHSVLVFCFRSQVPFEMFVCTVV